MDQNNISCDLCSSLDRLRLERETIENVLNLLRPNLPNPNIQLFIDVSKPMYYGAASVAAANSTYIVVFLSSLDGAYLYAVEQYFGHINFERMAMEERQKALMLLVALSTNTIAHECVHICQNINVDYVDYIPYNNVIEEDAIWRSTQFTKSLLPSIPDDIMDVVMKNAYAKAVFYTIKDFNALANDIHRYYLLTMRHSLMFFYFDMYKFDNVLDLADNIVILNQLNGKDEIINIKSNGLYFEPSLEYSMLINTLKLGPEGAVERMKSLDISLEYEYNDSADIINLAIRVSGTYLLPGLIDNIYNYYGIADIYESYRERLDGLL